MRACSARGTLEGVILALAAAAALASPLGSPVALTDHGVFALTGAVSGNGARADLARFGATSGRADVTIADGFGAYADASWLDTQGSRTGTRNRGWQTGGGVRGCAWLGRTVAIGGTIRGGIGQDWLLVQKDGSRSEETRVATVAVAPSLVFGARGAGGYAWIGPVGTLVAHHRLLDTTPGLVLADPPAHVGAELGGELVSENLVGYGARGHLFARAGGSVRVGDAWGLALWAGFGW